jgi:hypothetical protein
MCIVTSFATPVFENLFFHKNYCHTDHDSDPTFLAFKSGVEVSRMSGVNELFSSISDLCNQYLDDPEASGSGSRSDSSWIGASTPKNYSNVTANIEKQGLDLMNSNTALGGPAILFDDSKPSGLNPKAKSTIKDWVESDTDEQLMLFIPFKGVVKLHSIHITSLPPASDEDDDEAPSRPKTVKLFCNTPQILGFEEAEEREATQIIEFKPGDWNKDGSAVLLTKFVKFQSCSALTIFFQDVEMEDGEKVRIDRVRIIGEVMGEKVDMTKLKQQEE